MAAVSPAKSVASPARSGGSSVALAGQADRNSQPVVVAVFSRLRRHDPCTRKAQFGQGQHALILTSGEIARLASIAIGS